MTASLRTCRVGTHVVGLLLVAAGGWAQSLQPEPKPVVWGEYSEAELTMTRYAKDTNAHAVFLYDYGKMTVDYSGAEAVFMEVHRRIKLLDDEALQDLGILRMIGSKTDYSISRFEAKVVNVENGSPVSIDIDKSDLIKEEIVKGTNEYKVSFPSLKAGSVIEYRYRTSLSLNSILFMNPWTFQRDYPVVYSQWEGLVPTGMDLRIVPAGMPQDFQEAVQGQAVKANFVYNYVLHHLPAFPNERLVIGKENFRSRLDIIFVRLLDGVSSFRFYGTWPDFAGRYYEAFSQRIASTTGARKKAKELIGEETDKTKIISTLVDYVARKVPWNGDRRELDFSESISDGLDGKSLSSGGKNTLLIGMLRGVDIDAYPVLIRLRSRGDLNASYPILSEVDHIVVAALVNDEFVFLDATHPYHPPLQLPWESMGNMGVLLKMQERAFQFVELPDPPKTNFTLSLTAKLVLETATISGKFSSRIQGIYANDVRQLIAKDSVKAAIREFVFDGDTTLQFSDFTIDGLDDPAAALSITGNFTLPAQLEELDGEYYFTPAVIKTHTENPFTSTTRTLPIMYSYLRTLNFTAIIELPEGYSLVSPLPAKTIAMDESRSLLFKRLGVQQDQNIFFTTTLIYNKLTIMPEEYPALKSFFDYVVQLQAEQFVIRPN